MTTLTVFTIGSNYVRTLKIKIADALPPAPEELHDRAQGGHQGLRPRRGRVQEQRRLGDPQEDWRYYHVSYWQWHVWPHGDSRPGQV